MPRSPGGNLQLFAELSVSSHLSDQGRGVWSGSMTTGSCGSGVVDSGVIGAKLAGGCGAVGAFSSNTPEKAGCMVLPLSRRWELPMEVAGTMPKRKLP